MKYRRTEDFAVVGIHQNYVTLEANEWDVGIDGHWVVTLYLNPEDALLLADKLRRYALGMQIKCSAGSPQ